MTRYLLAATLTLVGVGLTPPASAAGPKTMTVHVLSAGQALATLIEFPCGMMMIDTGSQDAAHEDRIVSYIDKVFASRPDLPKTLQLVLITHNHIDHTRSLPKIVKRYKPQRFINHGITNASGSEETNNLTAAIANHQVAAELLVVKDSDITSLPAKSGLTSAVIDPFDCGSVNPQVRILSGRLTKNPGFEPEVFGDPNNHSLIVRIDFGQSSFLFLGDMEAEAIATMVDYYSGADRKMLDVDVLQVSHHGSRNGTTKALLEASTPSIAVMGVGRWNFGLNPKTPKGFDTFTYGHPRSVTLDLLENAISRTRVPKSVMVASDQKKFHKRLVTKAIYATGWDGAIRVVADASGTYEVFREF
jgi:competence protein ComEC